MKTQHFIFGFIVATFIFLTGASVFLFKQKQDFNKKFAVFPEFCLPQAIDSALFCNTQIDKEKPVVIKYMHPECEHCKHEAQEIRHKPDLANTIQWVLVSFAERDSLNQFATTYQLDNMPNLTILMDAEFELFDLLQVNGRIPSCYIYDRRLRLVKVSRGTERLEKVVRLAGR